MRSGTCKVASSSRDTSATLRLKSTKNHSLWSRPCMVSSTLSLFTARQSAQHVDPMHLSDSACYNIKCKPGRHMSVLRNQAAPCGPSGTG